MVEGGRPFDLFHDATPGVLLTVECRTEAEAEGLARDWYGARAYAAPAPYWPDLPLRERLERLEARLRFLASASGDARDPHEAVEIESKLLPELRTLLDAHYGLGVGAVVRTDRGLGTVIGADRNGLSIALVAGGGVRRARSEVAPAHE